MGAPAAIVEASGFIWETKGHSAARPETPAAAPVATKRKSRRVGWSAEDVVVTIPNPFSSSQPVEPSRKTPERQRDRCRRPRPPRRQGDRLFRLLGAKQAVQNRSIGTLAERAQAHTPPARVQCTKSVQTVVLFNHSGDMTRMELALFQPDISQNTGTILRL